MAPDPMTNHAAGEPAEREAFERMMWAKMAIIPKWREAVDSHYSGYTNDIDAACWVAWQARAALNAPAAVELTIEERGWLSTAIECLERKRCTTIALQLRMLLGRLTTKEPK
jgi:hypothetical protein